MIDALKEIMSACADNVWQQLIEVQLPVFLNLREKSRFVFAPGDMLVGTVDVWISSKFRRLEDPILDCFNGREVRFAFYDSAIKMEDGCLDWESLIKKLFSALRATYFLCFWDSTHGTGKGASNVYILSLLLQIAVVQECMQCQTSDFNRVLYYYRQLIRLDSLKIKSFFQERDYLKYATSVVGSINQNELRWDKSNRIYCEAIKEDERWHHQMASFLLEKYNDPIERAIENELKQVYPNRRILSEKMKYEKDRKRMISKEMMTKVKLLFLLKDSAKKYGRFYNPGAKK